MATEITANPEELRKYADDMGRCQSNYRTHLFNCKSQVDSLKNIWTGEAASAFYTNFQKLYDQCNEGLDLLSRMEDALFASADAYEKNEKAVQAEASKMPKLPGNTMR